MNQSTAQTNIKVQKSITIISIVLFLIKIAAYFITVSVAIFTDALESVVNIIAAFIGLYSLTISAMPRDADHPYGHGKIEYISAAIEGVLIAVAGITILYTAIKNLIVAHQVKSVDLGILLILATAIANYFMGKWCKTVGRKNKSLALEASGEHLITDTYTTMGIVLGLILIKLTNLQWIDSLVAIVVAVRILYTAYKILKASIEGIMDKADMELLQQVIHTIQTNRNKNWIDLHNLRIQKFGAVIHLDAHLTVPWYFNVHEAHVEVDKLDQLIKKSYGDLVELFVHTDACVPSSCTICNKIDCAMRKSPQQEAIVWTLENTLQNKKHKATQ